MTNDITRWLHLQKRLTEKVRERQLTGELLTLRESARLLRRRMDTVLVLADDAGLNVNVGIATYAGIGLHELRGDWTLEDLSFDPYAELGS